MNPLRTPVAVAFLVTAPASLRLIAPVARGLARRGHGVALACGADPSLAPPSMEDLPSFTVPHLQRRPSVLGDLRALAEVIQLLRVIRPSVLDVSTPKAGLVGALAARAAGVHRCIYTLRGLRLESTALPWRTLLYLAEWITCRSAHRVVAVAPSLLERTIGLRLVDRANAEVLGDGSGGGVDTARFRPDLQRLALGRAVRDEMGVPPGGSVVGYVGRIVADKGIEQLLEAHEMLRAGGIPVHLLLVGDVDPSAPLRPALRDRLLRQPALTLTGWVAHVERYLWALDLFVLPSWREGFPGSALEAQAAGIPVITTSVTGARDAVVDGETGLIVPPRDSNRLAEAMRQLLDDRDLAARMASAAAARVATRFEQSLVIDRLVDFYERQIKAAMPIPTAS